MTPLLRALIVDDDPLSRDAVRAQLQARDDVEVLDEVSSSEEALDLIRSDKPDVVFLDVELPGKSGIELMKELDRDGGLPFVVFVSAYDRFAVDAFDPRAVAYLLKPFDEERFNRALDEARSQVERHRREDAAEGLLSALEARGRSATALRGAASRRLMIREKGRVVLLDPEAVHYIQSDGNYLQLHLADRFHLVRATMDEIIERLDDDRFIRIHRSTIVNIHRIVELRPDPSGAYTVVTEGDKRLTMSRSYRDEVLDRVI